MSQPPISQPPQPPISSAPGAPNPDFFAKAQRFFNDYLWIIVRNIIGWLLIPASLVLAFFPGPLGLPIFLIGFALVTFPGKRRLTARVLRGRRLRLETRAYAIIAGMISIIIPGITWWILWVKYQGDIRALVAQYTPKKIVYVLTPMVAILLTWLVTRLSLKILNGLLRLLPRFRRKFRPLLARLGFKLLPPRHRGPPQEAAADDEILEISPRYQSTAKSVWRTARPWVRRAAAVGITVWIVARMVRPLRDHWSQVREQIAQLAVGRFLLASVMFAIFLLCFRALAWRQVLKGFGYKLPYAATARIWSLSELARYLPGAIWQVIGRVFLSKPYGIPGSIITTSQILEICIFLLANVLLAASCLLWFGQKMLHNSDARPWLLAALALVPTLGFLLHPRIFYTAANAIMRRLGKPTIIQRLRGRKLIGLLFWMMIGLLWQSAAVYQIVDPVLGFHRGWWWVVAGAYCLAWIAGFLAIWAPGGIIVREWVFVVTMQAILPHQIRERFSDPADLAGLLVLLGFLLRLWTVLGELIFAAASLAWDYRGALNRPDAPGRITQPNDCA